MCCVQYVNCLKPKNKNILFISDSNVIIIWIQQKKYWKKFVLSFNFSLDHMCHRCRNGQCFIPKSSYINKHTWKPSFYMFFVYFWDHHLVVFVWRQTYWPLSLVITKKKQKQHGYLIPRTNKRIWSTYANVKFLFETTFWTLLVWLLTKMIDS